MTRTKRTDPAPEPQEQSTALALPDTPALMAAYREPQSMEAILARIENEALAVAPDLSTAAGRKDIASLAFKVARSKTALDKVGADLIEDARKTVEEVNAKRRDVRDRLDTLKTKVRAPLDAWEAAEAKRLADLAAAEAARVADLEDRLRDFTDDLPDASATSERIAAVLTEIETIPVDATWQEFEDRAGKAKTAAVERLTALLGVVRHQESERAELERLRAEAAAREQAEQRRLADERRKVEAERIEREKAETAERAARAAEERAAREAEAAARAAAEREAALQRQLAEAKAREDAAATRERERIAAEQARADAERRAREADQSRRAQVQGSIVAALAALGKTAQPADVAEAIMAGHIPHVKVEM